MSDLELRRRSPGRCYVILDEMRGRPAESLGCLAVGIGVIYEIGWLVSSSEVSSLFIRTDEEAIFVFLDTGLFHGLMEHIYVWFADQGHGVVVTVRDSLKKMLDSQETDDPLPVGDIGVGQEPQLYLARINVLQQLLQVWAWLDEAIER